LFLPTKLVSSYSVGKRPESGGYTSVHWWHTNGALQGNNHWVLGQRFHEEVWTCSWCTCITGFHTLFLPTKLVSSYSVGKRPGSDGYTSSTHWSNTNVALQIHKHWVLGQLLQDTAWTGSSCTCKTGFHTLFLPTKLVSSYSVGKRPGSGGYTSAHWWHTN
jgi:hypothetical protein